MPSSARQASDLAAGPQPGSATASAPAPTSYNSAIVDNATTYENRHGEIPYLGKGANGMDCSNWVNSVLRESDPNNPPGKLATPALRSYLNDPPPADGVYEKVDPSQVKPGDLVLFNPPGHVGIVTSPLKDGAGSFIGSQSSTGVAETVFGPKTNKGFESPIGYLRYKGGSNTKGSSAKTKAGDGKGDKGKGKGTAAAPEATKVTNNDKEVAHKKSNHQATSVVESDVHWPVGKGFIKSFINVQNTSALYGGSVKTFIEKAMIWLKDTGRVGPTDPTHPSHLPGVISGTYQGPARAVRASSDTKVEGQFVVREGDFTLQNTKNTFGMVKKAPPPEAVAGKAEVARAPAAVAATPGKAKYGTLADGRRYALYPDGTVKVGNRPWRNNNPGNISDKEAYGAIGHDGTFAIYPDPQTGMNALNTKLQQPNWQNLTIEEAMGKYAPPTDGNNTERYINNLTTATGATRDTKLRDLTPAQMSLLQSTIANVEGFNQRGQTYNVNDPKAPPEIRALAGGGG
jgi:hypothetical protein